MLLPPFAVAFTAGAIVLQSSGELPARGPMTFVAAAGLICVLAHELCSRRQGRPASVPAPECAARNAASTELQAFAAGPGGARASSLPRERRGAAAVLFTLFLWGSALAAGSALGYGWSAWRATERFSRWVDTGGVPVEAVLEGTVVDLPQPFDGGVRFAFDADGRAAAVDADGHAAAVDADGHAGAGPKPVQGLVLLTWYTGQSIREFQTLRAVRGGERWRLHARIRRPHANANPLVFDYEAALLERGVVATGTVRSEPAPEAMPAQWSAGGLLARVRETLRDRLWSALGEAPYRGVIIGLAIGDQQAISNELWREFNRTGISHLMSISGLHVTMFAALAGAAAAFLWRRIRPLPLIMPAQKIAALAGLLGAATYCALAGFGVPAQRTLYMLTTAALALLLDRWHSAAGILAAALVIVVTLDPWAPLTAGFWLSFCAVAVLFYAAGHAGSEPPVQAWLRAQTAVTVGLAPMTLAIFKQVSLIGPLVNAVAIPFVSFVITPLSLLAAVSPYDGFARLAHALLALTMPWLHQAAAWPYAVWAQHAPALWTVIVGALGACWMLAPRGIPARFLGFTLMVPMLFLAPEPPAIGEAAIDVLDVGQGLAVVIRTHAHTILYDPGPRYGPEADAGDRVVVPYLLALGVRDLDRLIVTHRDADHSGGTSAVLRALPVALLQSSLSSADSVAKEVHWNLPCHAGAAWIDDGVRFEFVHPPMGDYDRRQKRTNAMSCVLRVAAASHVVLLTSDIEAQEERRLVDRHGAALAAEVLLVPHHGSRTSSTTSFLRAVDPRVAIVSAGYGNRFGHPRPDILERYRAQGIPVLNTARSGAIALDLRSGPLDIREFRRTEARYYRRVPDS